MRGCGPADGEIFAESVALQRVAKAALPPEYGLLEFEEHVLDRHRPWAAGARTLQEMGYGHLALLSLRRHGYRPMLGYLVMRTSFSGRGHYGMPLWPGVAASVRELLLTPENPAWLGDSPVPGQPGSCPPRHHMGQIEGDAFEPLESDPNHDVGMSAAAVCRC